jgi:hypothetical protein
LLPNFGSSPSNLTLRCRTLPFSPGLDPIAELWPYLPNYQYLCGLFPYYCCKTANPQHEEKNG